MERVEKLESENADLKKKLADVLARLKHFFKVLLFGIMLFDLYALNYIINIKVKTIENRRSARKWS